MGQIVAVDDNIVIDAESGLVLDELLNLLVKLLFWNCSLYLKEAECFKTGGIVLQSGADLFLVRAIFFDI